METLAQIRDRVYDLLDSDENDPFHTPERVNDAINTALTTAVDELAATGARRRFQKRVKDITSPPVGWTWNSSELILTVGSDFRRPWLIQRDTTRFDEIRDESEFPNWGPDGYMVMGRQILFTEGTTAAKTTLWYIYTPVRLMNDGDVPDFVEGYESYLAARAAAIRIAKADSGDPQVFLNEAALLWPSLLKAARQSGFPTTIHSARPPYLEDWYT